MTGTVVILGASRGLGKELSRKYQAAKWSVFGVSRSYANNLKANGGTIHCDLTIEASSKHCAELVRKLDRIDRFYWVAGQMARGSFGAYEEEDIQTTIDVNFRNPLKIVQAAWTKQCDSPTGGKMIIVASTAARQPKGGESIYCATKAAQASFAQSIAQEISNPMLCVGLVIPGGMKTGLWDGFDQPNVAEFNDPYKVAQVVYKEVENASRPYFEVEIPRGSV